MDAVDLLRSAFAWGTEDHLVVYVADCAECANPGEAAPLGRFQPKRIKEAERIVEDVVVQVDPGS